MLVPLALSRGKIDYYLLPLYPAVSVLIGRLFAGVSWGRLERLWSGAVLGLMVVALGAAVLRPPRPPVEWLPGQGALLLLGAVLAVSALAAVKAEGLADYVRRERGLGFDGIGCIHPRPIPVVHREMTPSEAEVERAVRIVGAAREAEERGLGAVAVGSKMVDPPVVRQAFRTVELAVAGGVLGEDWDSEG